MPTSFAQWTIFVATRREEVPTGCVRFLSVDGSVPGAALCWDHHISGELINLDAMPDVLDPTSFDGVGTTLADTDAVASVIAVMFGGRAQLPTDVRAVLESASHWCDHLVPHPLHNAEVNRLGRGLLDSVVERLTDGPRALVSQRFAAVCQALVEDVNHGRTLPFSDHFEHHKMLAARALEAGRIVEHGSVAALDLRGCGAIDPAALHAQHRCPVALLVENHPKGGMRYTVGINPYVAEHPRDLNVMLRALARAEFEAGPPALSADPVPGSENWGGRPTVFGSPWNYGSRLDVSRAIEIMQHCLL